MSKDTLIAVSGGALSGFASLAFLSGMPGALLAVYLAPLPLLLIGLDHGARSAGVAGASGIAVAAIAGGPMSGWLFAAIHALPAWIIVRQALLRRPSDDGKGEEWYPAGAILCILSLFGGAALTAATIWTLGEDGGLHGTVRAYLDQAFTYLMPTLDEGGRGTVVQVWSPLFPG